MDRLLSDGIGLELFVNPVDDPKFVSEIERSLDEGVSKAADLERRLRRCFPRAVVRPRDLSNERFVVWYVYRDGHWVSAG